MRLRQKIYCNKEFVESVIANRKKSTAFMMVYKAMLLFGDIYIDLTKEKIAELIKDNQFFKTIQKSSRGVHSALGWQGYINFKNTADELYLINPGTVESPKNIRTDFGCLIISSDDDIEYLERMSRLCSFSLIPLSKRIIKEATYKNSWSDVFKATKVLPINAAVICDNYIFGDKFKERKEQSLYEILRCIVPSNLKIPFHLTIFYYNQNGTFKKEKAEEIIKEIKDLELCSDMKVTIVAHTNADTTHDRRILTNYHYIYSGKGYNIIGKDGIKELSEGSISSIYHSIDSLHGDETIKHKYDFTQAWLKDIKENHINNPSCFIAGDNINRLLDD